jgi:hypothetical protein
MQRVGLALVILLVVVGLVLALTSRQEGGQQLGVWSPEHGHYH